MPRLRQRIVFALFLLLVFSVVANLALVEALRMVYARELAVRRQPVSLAPPIRLGNPDGRRVLLLGDSRIAEWPGLPANYFTINAGVAGETTAQILLRAPAILAAEKPDVVIIQAGINDLKAIGVAPGDSQKIESDCVNNLSQLTELADRHAKKVILTLILPAGKIPLTRRLFWSGEINRAVADANRQIMITFSHAPTVTVLDLEKILVAEPGIKSLDANYRDALHLTPQAYDKLQSAVVLLVGSSPPK